LRHGVPALNQEILDIFPDSFVESELGKIPRGWRVGTLGGVSMKVQYGFTAPAQEAAVGPRFLRIKDINKSAWIDWMTVPYCEIEPKTQEKYQLQPGDIVIARMADPGHAALIEESVDAVFASYLIRFRPLNATYDRYLQYWLRSDIYWSLVRSRQTGSTRANLNAKVLGSV
jgi:Type I restriction modification DNA specificity domain.